MLQERLNRIKDYFLSMEFIEGKWFVSVKYKPKWGAYPSPDGSIQAVPDEKNPCVYWYYSDSEDQDVETIVELIEETIQTNLDAIKKVELFKAKVAELQELFSDDSVSYRQLETLTFSYDDGSVPMLKVPVSAKGASKPRKQARKAPRRPRKADVGESVIEVPVVAENASQAIPGPTVDVAVQGEIPKHVESVQVLNQEGQVEVVPVMTKEEIDELRG